MPKYIIEREIPNAAALSPADLKAISQRSCVVLHELGPSIQWVQSYVTEDKITWCVYRPKRRPDPVARETRRIPGGSCAGGGDDHRPDDSGVECARSDREGVATQRSSLASTMPGAVPSQHRALCGLL
jgi:hypothetical protein